MAKKSPSIARSIKLKFGQTAYEAYKRSGAIPPGFGRTGKDPHSARVAKDKALSPAAKKAAASVSPKPNRYSTTPASKDAARRRASNKEVDDYSARRKTTKYTSGSWGTSTLKAKAREGDAEAKTELTRRKAGGLSKAKLFSNLQGKGVPKGEMWENEDGLFARGAGGGKLDLLGFDGKTVVIDAVSPRDAEALAAGIMGRRQPKLPLNPGQQAVFDKMKALAGSGSAQQGRKMPEFEGQIPLDATRDELLVLLKNSASTARARKRSGWNSWMNLSFGEESGLQFHDVGGELEYTTDHGERGYAKNYKGLLGVLERQQSRAVGGKLPLEPGGFLDPNEITKRLDGQLSDNVVEIPKKTASVEDISEVIEVDEKSRGAGQFRIKVRTKTGKTEWRTYDNDDPDVEKIKKKFKIR